MYPHQLYILGALFQIRGKLFFLVNHPIRVQHCVSGGVVPYCNVVLAPGDYDIYSNGMP